MSRSARTGIVMLALCFLAWLIATWLSDGAGFGWSTIIVFGIICVVALMRKAVSDYVSERVRRDARK